MLARPLCHDLRRAEGGPEARGRSQADVPGQVRTAVRASVQHRLAEAASLLGRDGVAGYLDRQGELHERLAAAEMTELAALAAGFGLDRADLFALLHLPVIADMAALDASSDGCTAFAVGPVLAKNRDVRPELAALQVVTAERDPDWPVGGVLSLGSLGAPGAYSSGMNAAGLALADTQVRTSDHGPGLSRYVLMNLVLRRARSVPEAVELVAGLPHAGGGTLVLADASGETAAVELRHSGAQVRRGPSSVRTNHFVLGREVLAPARHSGPRLALASERLAQRAAPAELLATRSPVPLCWHAADGDALATISGAIYDTAASRARVAIGPPGLAPWRGFAADPEVPGGWSETSA